MSAVFWRSKELLVFFLLVVLVALVFYFSWGFPEVDYSMGGSPALYPRLLAIFLLAMAAITLATGLRRPTLLSVPEGRDLLGVFAGAAVLLGAAAIMDSIGFRATAILVALAIMTLLFDWRKAAAAAIAIMAVTAVTASFFLHFVFEYLAGRPLPAGYWLLSF